MSQSNLLPPIGAPIDATRKNSEKRRVRIKRVINHPNYFESNKKYPRHDIALLETVDELYNSYSSAAPACLPQTARTMGETEQIMDSARGLDCFVAGYGQIAEKGPASSFLKGTRDSNIILVDPI